MVTAFVGRVWSGTVTQNAGVLRLRAGTVISFPKSCVIEIRWAPGRAGSGFAIRCIPLGQALRIPGAGRAMAWNWLALRAAPPIGGAG